MRNAIVAGAVAVLILGGCSRDANPPEQPSPGSIPKPTVAHPAAIHVSGAGEEAYTPRDPLRQPAAASRLFGAPGALPAAERHFELFQRLTHERAPIVKAGLGRDPSTIPN